MYRLEDRVEWIQDGRIYDQGTIVEVLGEPPYQRVKVQWDAGGFPQLLMASSTALCHAPIPIREVMRNPYPYGRLHNPAEKLRIAVLFDGAGLARLGLEQAGHECVGFEIDESKHHLSTFVGSGNSVQQDVLQEGFIESLQHDFDALWASPPCPPRSAARTQGGPIGRFAQVDLTDWALALPFNVLWVENVLGRCANQNLWGTPYNAAQFTRTPFQNRNRMIGGFDTHLPPRLYDERYRRVFPGVCPTIMATEYKGCASDKRRASRFYGRRLTLEEAAFHQGFKIPPAWRTKPDWWQPYDNCGEPVEPTEVRWRNNLYQAIGNGVPVYMAYAFGAVYSGKPKMWPWTKRWERLMAAWR